LLLVGSYLLYIFLLTRRWPHLAPPATKSRLNGAEVISLWRNAGIAAGPPIALLVAVLLSIYFGVTTPSEGGAVGVTATLVLALAKRRLTLRRLQDAMMAAGILCSCVLFLLFGASFFTLVFRGLDGHLWIEQLFNLLPAGQTGFLIALNMAIFLLAFFLDFFEIAFIVLPLIAPIARSMGIDMVWLGVLLAVNLQTSFMHPPFGIALYNLRSVTPRVITTSSIYLGAVPFVALQLLMVVVLIAAPRLVAHPPDKPIDVHDIQIILPAPDHIP
jgi:tripartite ATP-independent transporter DctM subunit